MRPDRLVVGEVREAESLDLLIALNSGLPGHVHDPRQLRARRPREALHAAAARRPQHRLRRSSCPRSRAASTSSCTSRIDRDGTRRVAEIAAPTGAMTGCGGRCRGDLRHRAAATSCPPGRRPARLEKFARRRPRPRRSCSRRRPDEPRPRRAARARRAARRLAVAVAARRRARGAPRRATRAASATSSRSPGLGGVPLAVDRGRRALLALVAGASRTRSSGSRCSRSCAAVLGAALVPLARARPRAPADVRRTARSGPTSSTTSWRPCAPACRLPESVGALAELGPSPTRARFARVRGRVPRAPATSARASTG